MGLTEPNFTGQPGQMETEDAEDTKKRTAIKRTEMTEEGTVTMSKEAPGRSDEREDNVENTPIAVLETAPGEQKILPVEKTAPPNEKAPEAYSRPPVTPRRNVIPQRRTSFDVDKTPYFVKKSALSSNGANDTNLSTQPPTDKTYAEADEAEIGSIQERQKTTPDFADMDTPSPTPVHQDVSPDDQGEPQLDFSETPTSELPALAKHQATEAEPTWTVVRERNQNTEEIIEQAAAIPTRKLATPAGRPLLPDIPTTPMVTAPPARRELKLTRGRAFLLVALLAIVIINATTSGFSQFFGPQGWGSAFNTNNSGHSLISQILHQLTPTPGVKGQATPTPAALINELLANMTLDQKLGQMMMVQFSGQDYSPALDAMISQYKIGAVLYFQYNIGSKSQLIGLNSQMQHSADLPLIVAVDQEGGTVDRLINLDGAQQSASEIGATGNPNVAKQQGIKDAQNLSNYGFNLNLAPVVDVHNVYNWQLAGRTYGNNPTIVTQMAGAYLKGLQQSGKVLGTLKHFPGLGDVSTDPHYGLPYLTRSLDDLNAVDWAPYRNLIKQGDVYSIMVTHEIVKVLDSSQPSSLSPQVIGFLRNQLHFQGVIITDSLTMDSIHNYFTYGDAAAKAVEAGDDILMGADSPNNLAAMINGIKQAMSSGAISQQHIDDSVRRILMFKYQMGLLHL